jgi:hypothetical protein
MMFSPFSRSASSDFGPGHLFPAILQCTDPCRFPKKVTKTAQYVAVPINISLSPASVANEIITENMKTKARTITAIHALLIGVKKNRMTGMNKTSTAKKTAMSRAIMLMRAVQ